MKNRILVVALVAAMVVCGGLNVGAAELADWDGLAVEGEEGGGDFREKMGRGPGQKLEMMAVTLDLDEAQKKEIETILAAERSNHQEARQEMREGRMKLRQMASGATFDEAAFRALATELAAKKVDLMVARAKTKSRIFGILTPEQQEKAEKIFSLKGKRHGKRGMRH